VGFTAVRCRKFVRKVTVLVCWCRFWANSGLKSVNTLPVKLLGI